MAAKVIDKKEKKDQIIEAALREFSKKGFARTTINDIANAAGIGKGTVYEYFAHKEEIIQHAFMHFMRTFEINFQEVLISNVPALEKFKQILTGFSGFIDSDSKELLELLFDFWAEGIKDKNAKGMLMHHMKQFYHAYKEIFADIIIEGMGDGSFRKDINPRSAAAMIVGCLDGLMVQWLMDKENFDFKGVLNTVTDILQRGIVREKS
jgi:TetR/AcrR family fatty acid metabolism transcriptional regulator